MAALPPDNTVRLWVDYETNNAKHSLMFRLQTSSDMLPVMEGVDEYFTALSGDLYVINILSARIAAVGSNVTLPIGWTGASSYGAGGEPAINMPRFVSFVGRGQSGRRWRLNQYGVDFSTPNDYRFPLVGENPLTAAATVLQDMADEMLITDIDGAHINVYAYVNFNLNDHWVGEARK